MNKLNILGSKDGQSTWLIKLSYHPDINIDTESIINRIDKSYTLDIRTNEPAEEPKKPKKLKNLFDKDEKKKEAESVDQDGLEEIRE